MNNDELRNKGYMGRKDDKLTSSYNFDLSEMTKDFDFYDFCENSKNADDGICDHGGVLVITGRQYVLSYNSSFGIGTHMGAEARIYTDIHGGGKINDGDEAFDISFKCNRQYICARIIYEYDRGYIHFLPVKGVLTEEMLRVFEKFYNDYNEDIKYTCRHFKFVVSFSYRVKGRLLEKESHSLDAFYDYLKSIVNKDATIEDDNEVIIGVTTDDKGNVR